MKRKRAATSLLWAAVLVVGLGALLMGRPGLVSAQSLSDYTAYPIFINQTVPPNILFIVDLSNATLPAAYGSYPISYKTGTVTASGSTGNLAANVNLVSAGGSTLVSSNDNGVTANSATTAVPSDIFDPTKSYYGLFDTFRCYATNSTSFIYGSVKTAVSDACPTTYWDGNFLNWLTMRKKDVAYQVLIGGAAIPAQSNVDGTSNKLNGETPTGENGSTNTCNSTAKPCWRYVKWVPATGSGGFAGRVPTTGAMALPADSAGGAIAAGSGGPGRFFGSGEGTIYINTDGSADPFDAAPANQYNIQVDLTTEPNVPSGTGSISDNCIMGDPLFAGHLICYERSRSLGLFQTLRTDNMHVGVMFVNAGSGTAGGMQFTFDSKFNASSITTIRNQHVRPAAPIAEALYEGLCVFRNQQGPCYNNTPADFSASVGTAGDPFYFASFSSMVPCCKSFVLMISPGIPSSDDDAPTVTSPFGNLFTGTQVGLSTTRLDDVAFYGQTHDMRNDGTNSPANATDPPSQGASPNGLKGKQNVTFYAVNAMGGAAGATTLASAATYGGFQDQDNNGAVELTGQTCTYPAGSNLGTGSGTSSAEWDANQDCVPDTYFDASEGGNLAAAINQAIAAILKQAASGTSISVLATSSTGEGSLYQAFFYPSTFEGANEIKWTGYVQGLFLDPFGNIREDSDGDGKLIYQNDMIIATRMDTATGNVLVDRFVDADGDGKADSTTPVQTVSLREMKGIWEAGKLLALRDLAAQPRNILTWVDLDHNGLVGSGEQVAFSTANSATLSPYLRAGSAPYTADNIINFILGNQISGLRNRQITVSGSLNVWRFGDPVHSTPTIVSAPKERFDVLYGDATYSDFFLQYKNRRQVAYVGANDGMLHAFNAGFYHRGDDPTTSAIEHGWFTTNSTGNSSSDQALGAELWGFIPYQLLPHLQWLTRTDYTHVYYVDLKPKVTDARIFTPDADHPNGWGTILIGGFRTGGSCGACTSTTGAPTMTVSISGTNYNFYSAYFVLDITNPEVSPKLLWVFSTSGLGLTTSYPTVLRMNPSSDGKTSNTNAKWYVAFGSGPTGYDGSTTQKANFYVVDLAAGPGANNGSVITMPVDPANASLQTFMADLIALDKNLDYRTDVAYAGSTINAGTPPWRGKLFRLTMGVCASVPCGTTTWGITSGSNQIPTEILATFPASNTTYLGPITASPAVTLDDAGKVWVFFGTGRFLSTADKTNTETQYLVGVKDSVLSGTCTQTSTTSCWNNNLVDVSNAQICVVCASGTNQVTGVTGVTTFQGSGTTSLIGLVQSMDGWFTTLPTSGERSIVNSTLIGGIVFYPTFIPSSDICVAAGNSNLYALFYQTGSAFTESVIGTATVGGNTNALRSMSLGSGLASSMALQLGAQGTGSAGAGPSGSGCQGSVMGFIQSSSGTIGQLCTKPARTSWSRYLSWRDQRD